MTTEEDLAKRLRDRAQTMTIGGLTLGHALRKLEDLKAAAGIADDSRRLCAYVDAHDNKPRNFEESLAGRSYRLMLAKDAEIEHGPPAAVDAVLRAIDNFEAIRGGGAGYTGPLADRVLATCRELDRRVSAGWEPQLELVDYIMAEFAPGTVEPAVVVPEAGVDIGSPAELAIRALKYAKARGAFEVRSTPPKICGELRSLADIATADGRHFAASVMHTAAGQIAGLEAASARWVAGRADKTAKPRKIAVLEEKLRRAELAMAELAKTIEKQAAQIAALEAANASLATDAGLWAREPSARTVPAGHCYPAEQHVVEDDGHGVTRFRQNRIIDDLVKAAGERRVGPDLNEMAIGVARGRYTIEERGEVNRLIGYSICGFEDAFPIGEDA